MRFRCPRHGFQEPDDASEPRCPASIVDPTGEIGACGLLLLSQELGFGENDPGAEPGAGIPVPDGTSGGRWSIACGTCGWKQAGLEAAEEATRAFGDHRCTVQRPD